jgi:hypothetical protein
MVLDPLKLAPLVPRRGRRLPALRCAARRVRRGRSGSRSRGRRGRGTRRLGVRRRSAGEAMWRRCAWDEPEKTTSIDGEAGDPEATRSSTDTYDSAGRVARRETTSTTGQSLPAVTYHYNTSTGVLSEQSTGSGSAMVRPCQQETHNASQPEPCGEYESLLSKGWQWIKRHARKLLAVALGTVGTVVIGGVTLVASLSCEAGSEGLESYECFKIAAFGTGFTVAAGGATLRAWSTR